MSIKMFVSHCSADRELAELFLETIQTCIELPDRYIRCTSVPGYKLPPGEHTSMRLRKDLEEAEIIIGLLTPDSLKSAYVLFELGAGWGLDKWTVAMLAPGVDFSEVPGPLKESNASRIYNSEDMRDFMVALESILGLNRRRITNCSSSIEKLCNYCKRPRILRKADGDLLVKENKTFRLGKPLAELDVPPGKTANEVALEYIKKLQSDGGT